MAIKLKLLLEMSVENALDLFGLTTKDLDDKEKVKKAYRKASFKYHPDRGGSDEEMKKVNDANEILKNASKSSSFSMDWDSIHQKYKDLGERIKQILLDGFDYKKYIDYFNKIYGDKFDYEITRKFPKGNERSPSYAGFTSEFFNKGRSIVFTFEVTSYLPEAQTSKTLGSGIGNISFPLMVTAYGLYQNKKLKVSQRDWKSTNDHDVLKNPELAFPKNKLEKFKTKAKNITFKRKDMITFLTKKLKGNYDGTWVKIPLTKSTSGKVLDDSLKLYLERQVFMRTPMWVPGLFKKYKGIPGGLYISLPETIETAYFFEELVNKARRLKNEEKIIKYIHNELKKKRNEKNKT